MYSKPNQQKAIAQEYKRKQIETAKPGELIVMLYDAALDSLKRSKEALQIQGPERIEAFHNALVKAQNIVTELLVALDLEKGGEVAKNLFRLYEFMHRRLVDANITKTVEPIEEVQGLLETLREAWVEVQGVVPADTKPSNQASINIQG